MFGEKHTLVVYIGRELENGPAGVVAMVAGGGAMYLGVVDLRSHVLNDFITIRCPRKYMNPCFFFSDKT